MELKQALEWAQIYEINGNVSTPALAARLLLAEVSRLNVTVTDERAAFDAWLDEGHRCGCNESMWKAWNARAILSALPAADHFRDATEMVPAAETPSDGMPELPEPEHDYITKTGFTAEQMRDYGLKCRRLTLAAASQEAKPASCSLRIALEQLMESVDEPPERNCSCHISPPCSDCLDHSGLREALSDAKAAIREHNSAAAPAMAIQEAKPVAAIHIGWDYLDDQRLVATYAVPVATGTAIAPRLYAAAPQEPAPTKCRDIFDICDAYESGFGHGLKQDGFDLSRTPHGDPEHGEAYQIGYEAGVERSQEPAQDAAAIRNAALEEAAVICDQSSLQPAIAKRIRALQSQPQQVTK